jgi:hypothetical protein
VGQRVRQNAGPRYAEQIKRSMCCVLSPFTVAPRNWRYLVGYPVSGFLVELIEEHRSTTVRNPLAQRHVAPYTCRLSQSNSVVRACDERTNLTPCQLPCQCSLNTFLPRRRAPTVPLRPVSPHRAHAGVVRCIFYIILSLTPFTLVCLLTLPDFTNHRHVF